VKIRIVTPAPSHSRHGNRVTALRWAEILRNLGHSVTIGQSYRNESCDVLVALHARRSFDSIRRFNEMNPTLPLIVALTGTDVYHDIHHDLNARHSLSLASLLVTLQPQAAFELPEQLRGKIRVIFQTVSKTPGNLKPRNRTFDVCVAGHLRPVKDPFRTALATHLLPDSSRIRVVHVGAALDENMEKRAIKEMKSNPRYVWLGELPRWRTRRVIARSRALVLSSQMEGGANVVSEAIVDSVPVLASYISGSIGLLGEDYSGYFPVGDTAGLARLLVKLENNIAFSEELKNSVRNLASNFHPANEYHTWNSLLNEIR